MYSARWCCLISYGVCFVFCFLFIFFFKQKTAYEIKECDWSSDVCSSDLAMYSGGLTEEVEHLLAEGFESSSTARQAIGYAEAVNYLKGQCSIEQAISQTIIDRKSVV